MTIINIDVDDGCGTCLSSDNNSFVLEFAFVLLRTEMEKEKKLLFQRLLNIMVPISKKRFSSRFLLATFLLFFISSGGIPRTVFSYEGVDTIGLSRQIADSLAKLPFEKRILKEKYSTVAFSRIQGTLDQETVNELIDFTNVAIVKGRGFKVIDRSKIQLILNEQKFNLTGMVSSDTYKELGKLLGVDMFLYGRGYQDTIVLKAIDVESSAIIWSDAFSIKDRLSEQTVAGYELSDKMINSLRKDIARLQANKINQISFWNIQSPNDSNLVIDLLSVAITEDRNFQVVERENLALILEEQRLNMQNFIDEKKAKRMGELYGIDAFIYGSITKKQDAYFASLKLLNIYTGVIEWADLIRFGREEKIGGDPKKLSRKGKKSAMVLIPGGSFIMGHNKKDTLYYPEMRFNLRSFYIDRTEVSNLDYKLFVDTFQHKAPPSWPGGKIPPGKENRPVVRVSWEDAKRYCRANNKRLPTESEWEKAFRGTNGNQFPWDGEKFHKSYTRTAEAGFFSSVDVDTANRDVSPYGVLHMAGNVREWVSGTTKDSRLLPYRGNRYRTSKFGLQPIRGGSFGYPKTHAQGWFRDGSKGTYAWPDVGFRCAK